MLSSYAVGMAGITSDEYTLVQSVLLRNALTNWIDGIPLNPIPSDVVRFEDILRGLLDLLDSGSLAGVPVRIRRRRNLDIQANHVILSGNDHDRAGVGVNCAFRLKNRD